ncbi:glycosyl hydrolase family 18 [Leucobacter insecticola]|uniref:Glycosyl hydrolase family 18 n=1 Tax=Leucobacter insecticola TaxID=2714934 RepID=A0A6G8FJR3_9MICO|nr:carbohydrate-binding protein [Leucobacter insecticola]QIM16302.1 glycosyl hydrolase family 18 [Leucobacter insecticola]
MNKILTLSPPGGQMVKWYPGRRLSWLRLGVVIAVVAALAGAGWYSLGYVQDRQEATERSPWFDAYVDVTATPTFEFESPESDGQQNVVLAFVVALKDNNCTPSWGGVYDLAEAERALDLDRRLARFTMQGGSAMVSFGGQANSDLALSCTDETKLRAGYEAVIDRYDQLSIDMDIEGELLANPEALARQARAIAQLQEERKGGDGLDVWLTLPVSTDGLSFDGLQAVRQYLGAGVELAGVNAMTMNLETAAGESMLPGILDSLEATQNQLRSLYQEVDVTMGEATAWSRISATPMIGQNDTRGDIFTLPDAAELSRFAADKGMSRMSMWSLNRDQQCGENWPDVRRVSDSCSGVDQTPGEFAKTLREGRPGSLTQIKGAVPGDSTTASVEDDPETSPYPIWSVDVAYPADTKVVWNRSVYEAKWWTQGDQPDLPSEAAAQPWRLLGPVLPGEKPVERPVIPAGTYPEWSKETVFTRGQRVIFEGVAFEAKWWTQGDSPDEALVQPQASPWRQLTDDEVAKIVVEK